jgi:cyclophilin family peptidyl-prolyl cis-trans isomerase
MTRIPGLLVAVAAIAAVASIAAACSPGATPSVSAPAASTPASPGASLSAVDCPTAQPDALPAGEQRVVTIETSQGSFDITVEADLSPIAAGNFVALAECGYYDGVVFHRVATLQDGTPFVIQGGDPTGTGTGGPGYTIEDEPVSATYQRGTVAMARTASPNSVGSQFFIVLDDGAADILASYNTYQIIGSVSDGIATADAILAAADAELPSDPVEMTDVSVSTP